MIFKQDSFKYYLLQPLLVAIFPGLFLFANNTGGTLLLEFLVLSLIIIIFSIIVFFLLDKIFKDRVKSSVFLTVFMIIFLNIGKLVQKFERFRFLSIKVFGWKFVLLFSFFIMILFFIFLFKRKNLNKMWATCLIYPFLFLNLFAVINVGVGKYKCYKLISDYEKINDSFEKKHFNIDKAENLKDLPNVYYIILDQYVSSKVLHKYYDYDNSKFLQGLKDLGFVVSDECYSNYEFTALSVSSSLNMNYHKKLTNINVSEILEEFADYWIKKNNVVKYFLLKGYKYLHISSHCLYTSSSPLYHDRNDYPWKISKRFKERAHLGSSFLDSYLSDTALGMFWVKFNLGKEREILLEQFQELKNSTNLREPYFIFSHILCPHSPYVVDDMGNSTYENWPDVENGYINQVDFVSKEIEKTIKYILKNSRKKPVIILQADHGVGTLLKEKDASPKSFGQEKTLWVFGILNAWYIPDENVKKLLYDNMSPVNNFRFIFDNYLNGDFELLKDYSFWRKETDECFEKVDF